MADLFMIIFLLSIVGLIIGFIKPGIMKISSRKQVLFIFIPIMLVSVILGASLMETDDNASKQEENETEAEEQQEDDKEETENEDTSNEEASEESEPETHEINMDSEFTLDDDTINFTLSTNLEDGTVVDVNVEHLEDADSYEYITADVENGEVSQSFDIADYPNGQIEAWYNVHPKDQSDDILEMYGEDFELMESDKLQDVSGIYSLEEVETFTKSEPVELSGNGNTATETFNLTSGFALLEMDHKGSSNFIVELKDEAGNSDVVVNDIGTYKGTKFATIPSEGEYLLDVDADGNWNASITQAMPNDIESEPLSVDGNGDDVIFFEAESGMKRFEFTHSGESNFIVTLNDQNVVVNEIGQFDGSTTHTLDDNGQYALTIEADGDWTVEME